RIWNKEVLTLRKADAVHHEFQIAQLDDIANLEKLGLCFARNLCRWLDCNRVRTQRDKDLSGGPEIGFKDKGETWCARRYLEAYLTTHPLARADFPIWAACAGG